MPQIESVRLESLTNLSTGQWSATVSFFLNPTGNEKRLTIGCRYNVYLVEQNYSADQFFAHDDGTLEWNYNIPYDQRDGLFGPIATGTITFSPYHPDPFPFRVSGTLPRRTAVDSTKAYYAIVTAKPFIHGDIKESDNRIVPNVD